MMLLLLRRKQVVRVAEAVGCFTTARAILDRRRNLLGSHVGTIVRVGVGARRSEELVGVKDWRVDEAAQQVSELRARWHHIIER